MLPLLWLLLLVCGICVLFSFPGILWLELRRTYSGRRKVVCPENRAPVTVELDARKAANSLFGPRVVSISSCTRWPEKEGCAQRCVSDALLQNPPDSFTLNHLGIFVAALASWAASGALRYSPIAREWMATAGMSEPTFWSRIGQRAPVIASFFGMLLVAYVFTWLMRHTNQAGLMHAFITGALLWLAILGITLPETVFFVPARVFAFDALAMLVAVTIQSLLIGLFVLPEKKALADILG